MKRRSAIGFMWIWGLWSAGSAHELLNVMPAWPLLLIGIAIAALIVLPRSQRTPMTAPLVERAPSH
jgi:hypothetical protein